MKQRVYLDTSVISALDDLRHPERAQMTRDFWLRLDEFEICSSEAIRIEIVGTRDDSRRGEMLRLLPQIMIHPLTSEMRSLARRYVDAAVFGESVVIDALHVAAAVLTQCEVLVSWNFRHLVNRRRRAAVNAINAEQGLQSIEIVAPPEV